MNRTQGGCASLCALLLCLCFLAGAAPARADGVLTAVPLPTAFGDSGLQVRLLQAELARRGYGPLEADGVYGEWTVKAVERFQRSRGLKVDGRAGETTLLALFARAVIGSPAGDADDAGRQEGGDGGNLTGMPAPSGPGGCGSHVKRLQEALRGRGYFRREADGAFGEETRQAVAAFQADKGIRADGRADEDTLRALYAKTAEQAGATEMPAWFGGGSGIIPWGAVFQVKDVKTGKVFTCRRMEGFNHIDAEPLTPYDTFVMQAAYGGEWSWDRRPVLLSYDGRVLAASMNGMPHGYSSIRTNAMRGHFCIHLFGSRNHGTQRVSATHQDCVLEASRAAW